MSRNKGILMWALISLLCIANRQAAMMDGPFDPYYHYRSGPEYYQRQIARPRLNFLNLNDLGSILVRTTVTSATTTYTFTTTQTCTKLAAVACTSLSDTGVALSSRVPFPTGFARSLNHAKNEHVEAVESVQPSQVVTSIEPTREARLFNEPAYGPVYQPYSSYNIDSSLMFRSIPQSAGQPSVFQGRFLFSTTRITVFNGVSTTTVTSTRTLTPGCSTANFFTQCP